MRATLREGQAELGEDQDPPPIHRVGDGAAAQREEQQRDELDEGQRGDRGERSGADEDDVRQRNPGDTEPMVLTA